jgi:putative membrane protein
MFYDSGWAWWQVFMMWIGMIAFWGVIIWAFVISTARHPGDDRHDRSARQILDERLARGELDTEEYRRLNDALGTFSERTPVDAENGSGR